MAEQKCSAALREAIWLAYGKKCAYTGEPLDMSDFHIDHILPESLLCNPAELDSVRRKLGLSGSFDILGYENLLPCRPGRNLQKGATVFDQGPLQYFLGVAASKKPLILEHLQRVETRKNRGRALILLQQCLEGGELTAAEVVRLLDEYSDKPIEIFRLVEAIRFGDEEFQSIVMADIAELRDRRIRLGRNDDMDSLTLTGDSNNQIEVRTCREYDAAIGAGYFPMTTVDMKMATFFEHQCGLLRALEAATTPHISHISDPRVGIIDLHLMPYSVFPDIGEPRNPERKASEAIATYQSKIDEGELVVKRLKQNLLVIEEHEGIGQQLIEVVRADFNGDGVEDILLFEYCYATHGTLGVGGIRVVTRRAPDALFEVIELQAVTH